MCRWASYFLNHNNKGPTKGVPWDYVVPASAVTELQPTQTAKWWGLRHRRWGVKAYARSLAVHFLSFLTLLLF